MDSEELIFRIHAALISTHEGWNTPEAEKAAERIRARLLERIPDSETEITYENIYQQDAAHRTPVPVRRAIIEAGCVIPFPLPSRNESYQTEAAARRKIYRIFQDLVEDETAAYTVTHSISREIRHAGEDIKDRRKIS